MKPVLSFLPALHCCPVLSIAQGLDPHKLLQKEPTDTWPTYNGDYSGRRFSPLTQIQASECPWLVAGLDVSRPHLRRHHARRGRARNQVHAVDGERHSLLHHSRSRVCAGCAHRPGALALRLGGQGRTPGRQSRRRHVRRTGCTSWRRMAGSSRWMRKTARSVGERKSPTRRCSTSPPWRPWW